MVIGHVKFSDGFCGVRPECPRLLTLGNPSQWLYSTKTPNGDYSAYVFPQKIRNLIQYALVPNASAEIARVFPKIFGYFSKAMIGIEYQEQDSAPNRRWSGSLLFTIAQDYSLDAANTGLTPFEWDTTAIWVRNKYRNVPVVYKDGKRTTGYDSTGTSPKT